MYNHNKAQQSKNRVHISWDILYLPRAIVVWSVLTASVKSENKIKINYQNNKCVIPEKLNWLLNCLINPTDNALNPLVAKVVFKIPMNSCV